MPLRLYNTLTHSIEPVVPADPANISFYTCGPTVYDDAHIGNFRAFLAADVLRRWLESPLCTLTTASGEPHTGPRRVTHVMNLTDVGHMTDDAAADGGGEDKMAVAGQRLVEAKKSGAIPADATVDPADPFAVAAFFADRFMDDARMLGLKVATEAIADPSLMPRATDNVQGMIRFIEALIDKKAAYVTGDPGNRAVYFDVHAFASYGRLSGNTLDNLRGGAGGRVTGEHQQTKRHPADFLLWKEDEKHLMKWESPWGIGYPGWHIECSVMSLDRLVPGGLSRVLGNADPSLAIDLHSGGEDNIFPHHECERAQSCCVLGGEQFARHWFHTRFLMVDGQKMSKSKGTMYTPRQLFAMGHEPAAVRLELIKAHYRSNADFSLQGLKDSAKMIEKWRSFVAEGTANGQAADAADGPGDLHPVRLDFARALSEDLNMAQAIGVVNRWINEVPVPGPHEADLFAEFNAVFGVLELPRLESKPKGRAVYLPGTTPSDAVDQLLEQRTEAKQAKDFVRADTIRDELRAMGYTIKDIAGGQVEVGPA